MERGKKPPLTRSNTGNLGSSKRHQILHTSPSLSFPFHLHRTHEDTSRSKATAVSPDVETYNYEYQPNQHPASLPTSRKGSLHHEMPERKISVPRNKSTFSNTGRECVPSPAHPLLQKPPNLITSPPNQGTLLRNYRPPSLQPKADAKTRRNLLLRPPKTP